MGPEHAAADRVVRRSVRPRGQVEGGVYQLACADDAVVSIRVHLHGRRIGYPERKTQLTLAAFLVLLSGMMEICQF